MLNEYFDRIGYENSSEIWHVVPQEAVQERFRFLYVNTDQSSLALEFKVRDARVTASWNVAAFETDELRHKAAKALEVIFFASQAGAKRLNLDLDIWDGDRIIRGSDAKSYFETGNFKVEVASKPYLLEDIDVAVDETNKILRFVVAWMKEVGQELFPEETSDPEAEGGSYERLVKRYERSRLNRDLAISHHGSSCIVCGFNFKTTYGEIGSGFIHVHHLEMLAGGGSRLVDPTKDMVPVCPNCHAMLHKRTPPALPSELREMMRRAIREQQNG